MEPSSEKLYFAYGSNMSRQQMAVRCPTAAFVGVGRLLGFDFFIDGRGVASVSPKEDCEVFGVLWRLSDGDLLSLDRFEGVSLGIYFRQTHAIHISSGESLSATVYVSSTKFPGPPRQGYLEKILQSADDHGLPSDYRDSLKKWGSGQEN